MSGTANPETPSNNGNNISKIASVFGAGVLVFSPAAEGTVSAHAQEPAETQTLESSSEDTLFLNAFGNCKKDRGTGRVVATAVGQARNNGTEPIDIKFNVTYQTEPKETTLSQYMTDFHTGLSDKMHLEENEASATFNVEWHNGTQETVTYSIGRVVCDEHGVIIEGGDGENGHHSPDGGGTPTEPEPTPTPTPEPTPTETCSENFGPAPFSDRASISAAHRSSIDCTYGLDIVRGFANNTYGYELRVRRDQMASFIARTLRTAGVELPEASGQAFGDVPADSVHAPNIAVMAEAGITLGTTATTFSPNLLVSRGQMASFLIRAAEYGNNRSMSSEAQAFSDVPPSNIHFPRVNGAAHTGIANGYPDGTYRPNDPVRRDQMATYLNRLFNISENATATQ